MTIKERLENLICDDTERRVNGSEDEVFEPGDEVWIPLRASDAKKLLTLLADARRLHERSTGTSFWMDDSYYAAKDDLLCSILALEAP